jgi:hypothetical protein
LKNETSEVESGLANTGPSTEENHGGFFNVCDNEDRAIIATPVLLCRFSCFRVNDCMLLQRVAWPSRLIKQETVMSLVQTIWDTYLGDHTMSQICMPSVVMSNTKLRIDALSAYGPEVFGECLLDPIKTLQRDILPRFLCSAEYNTMKARLNSLIHLPPAALLIVPPPESSMLYSRDAEYFSEKRMFTLDEILHDRLLHNEFHAHLKKSVQTENLLCVRMVEVIYVTFTLWWAVRNLSSADIRRHGQ